MILGSYGSLEVVLEATLQLRFVKASMTVAVRTCIYHSNFDRIGSVLASGARPNTTTGNDCRIRLLSMKVHLVDCSWWRKQHHCGCCDGRVSVRGSMADDTHLQHKCGKTNRTDCPSCQRRAIKKSPHKGQCALSEEAQAHNKQLQRSFPRNGNTTRLPNQAGQNLATIAVAAVVARRGRHSDPAQQVRSHVQAAQQPPPQ